MSATSARGPGRPWWNLAALGPDGTGPATVALGAVTVAVALGMGRLFAGGAHVVPFVAAALVGHGAMWAGRRLGWALWVSALATLGAVAVVASWLILPETTTLGIPGPGTLAAARDALAESWSQFAVVVAPTPADDGFLLAGIIGVGATAVLSDWAAFRMRVVAEAVVPSFTLFVFTATLGADGGRTAAVVAYLAALLAFLAVHRSALESRGASWFASRSRGGLTAVLQGTAALAAVAVVAAVVVGPRLPGATAEAVLDWRDADGPGGDGRRTIVSPLVDIRGRLVEQAQTVVFEVKTTEPAYWRLTSLDTFDGRLWSSDASYRSVKRTLPEPRTVPAGADVVLQEFTIRSLSSIFVPAAYRPARIGGDIDDVSYNADLGSLITGDDTTDGLTYVVESAVPRLTTEGLQRADDAVGADPGRPDAERFLSLPRVSRRVNALARRLDAGSDGTDYGKALAIQSFFRQEGFEYDLEARSGHDENALETFLFAERRGYCEQFAGAYGVLARLMGLRTRVAVGFTPGEVGDNGTRVVRGLNAHAWPEVYLDGAGWVAFEPTPGRGAPGAEAYTGVPEAQAQPTDPSTATTAPPTTTTTAPDDTSTASTTVPEEDAFAAEAAGAERPWWRHPVVLVMAVLLAVALLAGAGVPAAKAARRRRRRAGAATPADRVWVAWTEAADAVGRAGAPRLPAETLDEHARRAAPAVSLPEPAGAALAGLAARASAASYAVDLLEPDDAERAVEEAGAVEAAVRATASARRRLLWSVDPRPLLGGGRRRRR